MAIGNNVVTRLAKGFSKTDTEMVLEKPEAPYDLPHKDGGYIELLGFDVGDKPDVVGNDCCDPAGCDPLAGKLAVYEIVKYSGRIFKDGNWVAIVTERGVGSGADSHASPARDWVVGSVVVQGFVGADYNLMFDQLPYPLWLKDHPNGTTAEFLLSLRALSGNDYLDAEALRNVGVPTTTDQSANVLSYDGGEFTYDSLSTASEDGIIGVNGKKSCGTIIKPNGSTGSGRWIRRQKTNIKLRWFVDLTTSPNATIQTNAFNAVFAVDNESIKERNIDFDYYDYEINGQINVVKGNRVINGNFSTITQKATNTKGFHSDNVSNIHYKDFTYIGFGEGDTPTLVNSQTNTISAQAIGINFWNGNNFSCDNLTVLKCKNIGIQHAYSSNVSITNCHIEGTYPDSDIPIGNTARQQFGILCFASSAFVEGSSGADNINGIGQRHLNKNIYYLNNSIGNTAIALCVFPGFSNISMENNKTFGVLTQHSAYAYPDDNCFIVNNIFAPTEQQVGIKISHQQSASYKESTNVQVINNVIQHNHAPAISFEVFDRLNDGSLDLAKAGSWFKDCIIKNNIISKIYDIGISAACVKGVIKNNTFKRQSIAASARSLINLRSFEGEIINNLGEQCNSVFLSGFLNLKTTVNVKRNTANSCGIGGGSIMSTSLGLLPIAIEAGRWFGKNNYCSVGNNIYECLKEGKTDGIPTGTVVGVVEDIGTAQFAYVGDFTTMKTSLIMQGNEVKDEYNVSTSTIPFLFYGALLSSEWINNKTDEKYKNSSRIQGIITNRVGNNFYNSHHLQTTYELKKGGVNRNTYSGNVIPPAYSTDFYEKGDVYINNSPSVGSPAYAVCIATARSGTADMWAKTTDLGLV